MGGACTTSEISNRKVVEAMKQEKRDLGAERERNRKMKLRLQSNTFHLGNERDYMY